MTCLRRWGTYTVNSAFNESVLSIVLYGYVWSAEKLYAWTLARSKSVKEVLTYLSLSQDFFLSFFFPISRKKKICINRFLCLLALTPPWGVALQSEKSDLRFTLQCPQQLINIKEYDTMFVSNNQDFVWQELPPAEARIGVVPRRGNSMDRNLIMRKNIVIRDF